MIGEGELLFIVVGWIILSVAAGVLAESKGHSALGYTLLGLLLSPLIALIVAACLPRSRKAPDGIQPELLGNGDILVPVEGGSSTVRLQPGDEEHAAWLARIQRSRL
jgi:hypothetical protein